MPVQPRRVKASDNDESVAFELQRRLDEEEQGTAAGDGLQAMALGEMGGGGTRESAEDSSGIVVERVSPAPEARRGQPPLQDEEPMESLSTASGSST